MRKRTLLVMMVGVFFQANLSAMNPVKSDVDAQSSAEAERLALAESMIPEREAGSDQPIIVAECPICFKNGIFATVPHLRTGSLVWRPTIKPCGSSGSRQMPRLIRI